MKKKKLGFTLVELLAVIVILAVILVIAVPRIAEVIENSKKATFESSAKTIASTAEKRKMENDILENTNPISCSDVVSLNSEDYSSCTITFDGDTAKVSMIGSGKFEGLQIKNATKDSATATEKGAVEYGKAATYITELYASAASENGLKKDNTTDANIRYYGGNPNNYVSFNNELWRIIGVFDGYVKLIRNESLGVLSWDSSAEAVNSGYGINQWGASEYESGEAYEGADLQIYLNKMYYGGTTVTCYGGSNNYTTTCSTASLNETAKSMIDYHLWNTGAYQTTLDLYTSPTANTVELYNEERGDKTGKECTSGDYCNDKVKRTATWNGYVALPYLTDFVYASSLESCETNIFAFDENFGYLCSSTDYNWMEKISYYSYYNSMFFLSVSSNFVYAYFSENPYFNPGPATGGGILIYPSLYLKNEVKIIDGSGTSESPYILSVN